MAPPKFADFGKAAKDLFKKGYEYKNEAKFNTKAPNGAKIECAVNNGKSISGYGKGNFDIARVGNVEIEASSSGSIKGQAKVAGLPKGASSTLSGNTGGDLAIDSAYAQNAFHLTKKISYNTSNLAANINLSLSAASGSFAVGGGVDIDGSGSLKEANAGAQYSQSDVTVAVFTSKNLGTVNVSYYQKVSADLVSGASISQCLSSGNRAFTLGGQYKLDGRTSVKGKVDSKGIVGTSVAHTLSDCLSATIGAEFDTQSSDVAAAKKFGIALNLNY